MINLSPPNTTRRIGKAQGYLGLSVADMDHEGTPLMLTLWQPTPTELARLIASAPDLAAKVLRLRAENAMMQHELERQVGIADAEADRAERAEARVAGLEAQIAAHRALKEVGK